MAIFETIVILEPEMSPDDRNSIIEHIKGRAQSFSDRKKVNTKIIGEKRLAFAISNCSTGYYILFTYEAVQEDVLKLERQLRATDEVIKFMTVEAGNDTSDDLDDLDESEQNLYPNIKPTTKKTEPMDALKLIYGIE